MIFLDLVDLPAGKSFFILKQCANKVENFLPRRARSLALGFIGFREDFPLSANRK